MIRLENFTYKDFNLFKSWIKNEDELLQFAGPIFSYPILDQELSNYINDNRRISYKVIEVYSGEIVGHCELNFENELPRLSRILIGNESKRSKGYGRTIVIEMLRLLFNDFGFSSADLNVFELNYAAIKCYEKVGFKFNEGIVKEYLHKGNIWRAKNMIINKSDLIKK